MCVCVCVYIYMYIYDIQSAIVPLQKVGTSWSTTILRLQVFLDIK